jgi:hypothetical protein
MWNTLPVSSIPCGSVSVKGLDDAALPRYLDLGPEERHQLVEVSWRKTATQRWPSDLLRRKGRVLPRPCQPRSAESPAVGRTEPSLSRTVAVTIRNGTILRVRIERGDSGERV